MYSMYTLLSAALRWKGTLGLLHLHEPVCVNHAGHGRQLRCTKVIFERLIPLLEPWTVGAR